MDLLSVSKATYALNIEALLQTGKGCNGPQRTVCHVRRTQAAVLRADLWFSTATDVKIYSRDLTSSLERHMCSTRLIAYSTRLKQCREAKRSESHRSMSSWAPVRRGQQETKETIVCNPCVVEQSWRAPKDSHRACARKTRLQMPRIIFRISWHNNNHGKMG